MRDEPQDSSRDIPESDRSELETVVAGHVTTFIFHLDLDTKKRLNDIMAKRSHTVFSDAIRELINEEHERSIGPEDVVGEGERGDGLTRGLRG